MEKDNPWIARAGGVPVEVDNSTGPQEVQDLFAKHRTSDPAWDKPLDYNFRRNQVDNGPSSHNHGVPARESGNDLIIINLYNIAHWRDVIYRVDKIDVPPPNSRKANACLDKAVENGEYSDYVILRVVEAIISARNIYCVRDWLFCMRAVLLVYDIL